LAVLLTRIIPLTEPYATGLILLSMTPCAPFFPTVAQKVGADLAYVTAFMLLAIAGTILFMPAAAPWLLPGFKPGTWAIAKPVVFYIAAPLVIASVIRSAAASFAHRVYPFVKKVTVADMLIMLALVLWIYGADFLSSCSM